MIDEEMTVRMFGYTSDMLLSESHKKIVVMCDECGVYRIITKDNYRDLCFSCGHKGKIVSEETRQKMSVAKKNMSDETRQKMSDAQKGKKASKETRQKISDSHKNRAPVSEETRQKISDATEGKKNPFYGKKHSEETRQKISDAEKGKIISEETRQKMSDALKNPSEETRQRMSDAAKGKIVSEETRQKMSAAKQGIAYDVWVDFAKDHPYCPRFNEVCRESNREKYGRRCFICGKPESENITSTGKFKRLSVHHVDRNKDQGCNGHDWALVPTCLKHHAPAHSELWTARIVYLLNHVWDSYKGYSNGEEAFLNEYEIFGSVSSRKYQL